MQKQSIFSRGLAAGFGACFAAAVGPASADIVQPDDVIIQFSLCVGNDCVNGESFGFDTIRMKENNVRLHFLDTSNSASFPTNDWRIVANDSSNGGANYLAFEDSTAGRIPFRVEAGAPANALYVEADGDVGIKTANPVVDLHVVEGNTPTLRLEQDGSAGFTPQTWDLAGNEANFFIRDVTNGGKLSFKIKPGAPDNSIFIDAAGRIGFGTASPSEALHLRTTDGTAAVLIEEVNGTAARRDLIRMRNNGPVEVLFENTDASAAVEVWKLSHTGSSFRILNQDTQGSAEFMLTQSGDLQIYGNLTVNTGGTPASFPDYVFSDDYNLMPLQALEAYISDKRKLPKMPSALEVQKNGLDISSLQILTVEKIEEITLYLIEQDKQIKRLREKIASVESR